MVEYWDIRDEEGAPTGQTYRRGAPGWPVGRFHIVAATCVVRRDTHVALLTQRAAHKEFPLAWEFPGGSALAGETSAEAASRELREETGLSVPPVDLAPIGRFAETSALFDMYVASTPEFGNVTIDPDEVAAYEWVSLSEVERRFSSGEMAEPWIGRLNALWVSLAEAVKLRVD